MAHAANSTTSFPLYLHRASGHWCKTIKGRRHYFGKDKAEALETWHKQKDDLLAGVKPRNNEAEIVTVAYVCNYMLTKKKAKVDCGELSHRQYIDLKTMSAFVIDHFGRNRSVASLGPDDFGALRTKMAKRWAPSGLVARINNIRHIFRFAYENDVVREQVKFGDQFSQPSKKRRREARNNAGPRMFTPDEIDSLLTNASPHLKAFVLLGVNCGLGNSDIARMENRHIDLKTGWLNYPRPKTAVPRRAKLWDETVDAIKAARESQPISRGPNKDLVFLTRLRKPWSAEDSSRCALSQAFTKLAKGADVYAKGKTFYALRHIFETIAGEVKDQVAVDYAMGHDDGSMANVYREGVSDERLEAIADHVHAWLFRSGGKAR